MTKTVHFHVGSGRCGSTLIQALFDNAELGQFFSDNNLVYEQACYLATAPLVPAESLVEADWRDLREKWFRRHLHEGPDNLFVTQENIFGVRYEPDQKNICDASCDIIEYLTEGFRTHIVILLRRQDTFLESLYNQLVKRRETRDFETYLAEFPMGNIEWDAVVDVYADRFGRENVTVLPFERQVLETNDLANFVDAVLAAIDVPVHVDLNQVSLANPSLSPRAIDLQRRANEILSEEESIRLANWLCLNVGKRPDDPHGLMDDEQRTRILDRFRESNRRLFERHMPDYDPGFYLTEHPAT